MAFHVAPGTLHERRSGKRVPQIPAVPLRDDAIVQNQYGTAVCAGTDQAPEPLFQAERSVRQHEVLEGVDTAALQRLHARGGDRIRRHPEGQLLNEKTAQRVARDVDAFPERRRSEQDTPSRRHEAPEQSMPVVLPLNEEGPLGVYPSVTKQLRHAAQGRV